MRKPLIVTVLIVAALIAGSIALNQTADSPIQTNSEGTQYELVAYKSPDCGCCTIHADYMINQGYQVKKVDIEDMNQVKAKYDVPDELFSCHTTIVNDGQYFIEGHIPEQAISKLLKEEPDIRGIGMPGMPSGSPGMPGPKLETFVIMQVNHNGEVSPYMSI